jgi:hypothetical protein
MPKPTAPDWKLADSSIINSDNVAAQRAALRNQKPWMYKDDGMPHVRQKDVFRGQNTGPEIESGTHQNFRNLYGDERADYPGMKELLNKLNRQWADDQYNDFLAENDGINPNLAFDDRGFKGLPEGVDPWVKGNPFGAGKTGREDPDAPPDDPTVPPDDPTTPGSWTKPIRSWDNNSFTAPDPLETKDGTQDFSKLIQAMMSRNYGM